MSKRLPFTPDEGVRLEQVDRKRFTLLRGFTYTDPDGEAHAVTPEGVGETDLASVPSILWWFVASYGRHTRAALVHDQLVDEIERHDADWVFRAALADTGIGWVRRWLAWAAVSFATTFCTAGRGVDAEKTASLKGLRAQKAAAGTLGSGRKRPEVRTQWPGALATVVGFALVGAHFAAAVWLGLLALDGSAATRAAAALVALLWLAIWGGWRALGWAGLGRLLAFAGGAILIVPFTALLLFPLGVALALERGVWLLRTLVWAVVGRRRGEPPPPQPDFGITRGEAEELQRL